MRNRRPVGGGSDCRKTARPGTSTTSAAAAQALTVNAVRFRGTVERIHALGPRVLGELLLEAGADLAQVERFADLDRFPPTFLNAIGVNAWPVSIFLVSSST